MRSHEHGGTVIAEAVRMGLDEGRLLDLSASINPLGMPASARAALRRALSLCVHYPDTASAAFVRSVADRFSVEPERVLAANGSTELIYLLPMALRPRAVVVCAPTFSEYERAALRAGALVKHLSLRRSRGFRVEPERFTDAMREADMAFLCNPNNPTGHALGRDEVSDIARAARKARCVLVLDEAFADFALECSAIGEQNPYLVVLRSMTKFYGMAGIRLGYGIVPKSIATKLREYREPWTVNTLAERAGAAALADDGFRDRSLRLMERERGFMDMGIRAMGLCPLPSDANFLLLAVPHAERVADGLLRDEHIMVRRCANFRGLGKEHLRVAVRSRRENTRFLEALSRHV